MNAYSEGVFPWPTEGLPMLWYSPKRRGVLDFEDLHLSRTLRSFLKKTPWTFTVDEAFEEVIASCSDLRKEGTWITPEMKDAYCELHRLGHAHSVEVWDETRLIGGLYGVDTGFYFAGESMFHRESNASKAALVCSVGLQKKVGRTWMDIQVLSPHTESFGAKEISRDAFKTRIENLKAIVKRIGPSRPFAKGPAFTYGSLSMDIE